MEEWWKVHAKHETDPEWIAWCDRFLELYRIKSAEMTTEHLNVVDGMRVFGMSKAGGCTRASGLNILGYDKEDNSGSTNFTFWLGHTVEIGVLATLEAVGYPILNSQESVIIRGVKYPIMQSTSDAIIKILGEPTIVSVKSAAYKMSGRTKGKFLRRGFAELPFEGIRAKQPSWYAQIQSELFGSGIKQGLILVASKDIVKAFEDDEYLGKKGNGSLTFYAELIKPELELVHQIIDIHEEQMIQVMEHKSAGRAMYLRSDTMQYVELEKGSVQKSNIWGGKNKEITGTFNPCGGCQFAKVCADVP